MVQICCSAGVANSEHVADKTSESSCHSLLLQRKQDAYTYLSVSGQVRAAIAPLQSILHDNKQHNTETGVCQANE